MRGRETAGVTTGRDGAGEKKKNSDKATRRGDSTHHLSRERTRNQPPNTPRSRRQQRTAVHQTSHRTTNEGAPQLRTHASAPGDAERARAPAQHLRVAGHGVELLLLHDVVQRQPEPRQHAREARRNDGQRVRRRARHAWRILPSLPPSAIGSDAPNHARVTSDELHYTLSIQHCDKNTRVTERSFQPDHTCRPRDFPHGAIDE